MKFYSLEAYSFCLYLRKSQNFCNWSSSQDLVFLDVFNSERQYWWGSFPIQPKAAKMFHFCLFRRWEPRESTTSLCLGWCWCQPRPWAPVFLWDLPTWVLVSNNKASQLHGAANPVKYKVEDKIFCLHTRN